MVNSFSKPDPRIYFLFLCIFQGFLVFIYQDLIVYDNLFYEALGSQMDFERIQKTLDFQKQYQWVVYLALPIFMMIRILLVTCCLNIGSLLEKYDASFSGFFQASMYAQTIYLFPMITKLIYFYFIHTDYTLGELNSFNPFSLLGLFDVKELELWQLSFLGFFNLYQLSFVLFLAYRVQFLIQKDFSQSLGFVGLSYGAGLFIWIVFLMFLQLMLQP